MGDARGFVGPTRAIPFVPVLKCMGGENPEFIQKVSDIPSLEVIGEQRWGCSS